MVDVAKLTVLECQIKWNSGGSLCILSERQHNSIQMSTVELVNTSSEVCLSIANKAHRAALDGAGEALVMCKEQNREEVVFK